MALTQQAALWFFPFVLPICLYVCFTDMREMRITNQAVIALGVVFLVIGPFVLPFDEYLWRIAQLATMLLFGILLNAAGVMGAGDAKFIAAAAPYVPLGDLRFLLALFAAVLIAAVIAHKGARRSPLRRLAPHWKSWDQGKHFPMGLALGFCLATYLGFGVFLGS